MAERLKNVNPIQIFKVILYFIVIVEMFYFGFRGLSDITFVYILIIAGLLIYRYKFLRENPWISIKYQLNLILVKNGIIANPKIDTKFQLSESIKPPTKLPNTFANKTIMENQEAPIPEDARFQIDYSESRFIDDKVSLFNFDENTVEDLRSLGFDGILICIFLLKNEDVFVSAKSIMRTLDIPKSTLYRNISKLESSNYINSKYTLENPNKSFYQLTIDGRYLIYDLYRLIK